MGIILTTFVILIDFERISTVIPLIESSMSLREDVQEVITTVTGGGGMVSSRGIDCFLLCTSRSPNDSRRHVGCKLSHLFYSRKALLSVVVTCPIQLIIRS